MFTLRIIIIVTVIVPLNYKVCFCGCSRGEYKINKQCCPMCAPGNVVLWHCTDDTSTTCVPCPEFTFIDESNGLTKCFPCTVCDTGQGLRVNKACTRSSNTICKPLEGFFCIDKNKGSCTLAVKHSKCNPGNYIKQAGTASTDTVCGDCIDGTYSNGSFSSCLAHTKCEALGLSEVNPGTESSDAECGNSSNLLAVVASIGTVAIVALIIVVTCVYIRKKKRSTILGKQKTENNLPEQANVTAVGGRENTEPKSFRLTDTNRPKNSNLEMVSVSCLLIQDSKHSDDTVKPEHHKQPDDYKTTFMLQ